MSDSAPLNVSLLRQQIYPLRFLSFSSSSEVFCDSQRNILKENDIIRFPRLADTYQRIAEEGPDVFYNGPIARTIVRDVQAAGALSRLNTRVIKTSKTVAKIPVLPLGGIITLEDLRRYQPLLNENPLKLNVGEYTMHVPDAPSSGPVLALILNIVDGEQRSGGGADVGVSRLFPGRFRELSRSPTLPRRRHSICSEHTEHFSHTWNGKTHRRPEVSN